MSELVVRAYNVKFGDAILITVPDKDARTGREVDRHVLIDVGNVQAGEGGDDAVFEPIVKDIRSRLRNGRIDLYVMTHEHLDHVQGLYYASTRGEQLDVDYAWLTASAAPGYYDRHPAARKRFELMRASFGGIERHLAAAPAAAGPRVLAMMANNNPRRTSSCVEHLRTIARRRTTYVHRGTRLQAGVHHPFQEARLTILAPEEDTSGYYGRLRPLPLMVRSPSPGLRSDAGPAEGLRPPAGVDPRAFDRLLESWKSGIGGNLLAIDRAANNTSVVFTLEWRGWRLLFPGDAERRSWSTIDRKVLARRGGFKPVHFIKVAHHGSHNATPDSAVLDKLLPLAATDDRKRVALVSTCPGTYYGVPHEATLERMRQRCDAVFSTTEVAPGQAVEVVFEG